MSLISPSTELLAGKKVLITGGARGLGAAFVDYVVNMGARVVIADILGDLAQEKAEQMRQLGHDVQALTVDLSDPESISHAAEQAIQKLGGLDGLVNNAAITNSGGKNAHELSIDTWDQVMTVNVRGTWLMSRACQPALKISQQGAVVNIASDTALWGAPNLLAYATSKGAVISMTRSLAREWGEDKITVNAIAPGLVLVEATKYVPEARHHHYMENRAIKKEQLPEDVCGAVAFALSDMSRFITGQLLPVNGGFVMN